jgi:putative resolvase
MHDALSAREVADLLRVTVKTVQRWDRAGVLKPSGRTPGNRRVYDRAAVMRLAGRHSPAPPVRLIAYARVSRSAQRPDLANQRRVLEEFCVARGLAGVEFVEEIGGGLNFKRKRFLEVVDAIGRGEVSVLILAHRDRLTRFGYEFFEHYCEAHGCELLVLNQERLSPEREMVEDLMTIVHCFSSRLYGLRIYRKKLAEAIRQDQHDADPRA